MLNKMYLILFVFLFALGCADLQMQDSQYREILIDTNPQWSESTKEKVRENKWDNEQSERQIMFSVGGEEPAIIDVKNSCDGPYSRRRRLCTGQVILWKWDLKEPIMSNKRDNSLLP